MDDAQKQASKELMILTQIAENASITQDALEKARNVKSSGSKQKDKKDAIKEMEGRIGGMNKIARAFLRMITENKESFGSVFVGSQAKFIIARDGGVKQAKNVYFFPSSTEQNMIESCEGFLSDSSVERKDDGFAQCEDDFEEGDEEEDAYEEEADEDEADEDEADEADEEEGDEEEDNEEEDEEIDEEENIEEDNDGEEDLERYDLEDDCDEENGQEEDEEEIYEEDDEEDIEDCDHDDDEENPAQKDS